MSLVRRPADMVYLYEFLYQIYLSRLHVVEYFVLSQVVYALERMNYKYVYDLPKAEDDFFCPLFWQELLKNI